MIAARVQKIPRRVIISGTLLQKILLRVTTSGTFHQKMFSVTIARIVF